MGLIVMNKGLIKIQNEGIHLLLCLWKKWHWRDFEVFPAQTHLNSRNFLFYFRIILSFFNNHLKLPFNIKYALHINPLRNKP
jgi:hypothetical protein